MSKLSHSVKKRFVKDYHLPIKLLDDDMLEYYVDLYDRTHNTKYNYANLKMAIYELDGEEGFMKEFNGLKDNIINDICNKESYRELAHEPIPDAYIPVNQISNQKIYTPMFHGTYMISIDMKQANFNSLKYYNPKIVDDASTYDQFISGYTAQSYMKQSKQLRQVIFGNLLPKKQQQIQKGILAEIGDAIIPNITNEVTKMGTDELIILNLDSATLNNTLADVIFAIPNKFLDLVRVEVFRVEHIHPTKPFYARIYENGKVEIKNVPSVYYPQVYKKFFKIPFDYKDLLFEYEGDKVSFVDPLYSSY